MINGEGTRLAITASHGLELPPGFSAVALRESRDAFAHAQAVAAEAGAGTLVWVRRFDTAEFALVFEPDEPLSAARRIIYLAMAAVGDAVASYAPPEKPLTFGWPATLLFDGAVIGGGRLAWPDGSPENAVPDWLVVGFTVRTVLPLKAGGGHALDVAGLRGTSLEAEGFDMLDQAELVSSFARHVLLHVDQWQEKGFVPVGQHYLTRLPEEKGTRRGIDGNGDLLVRRAADPQAVERRELVPALAEVEWLDPATGEPWL